LSPVRALFVQNPQAIAGADIAVRESLLAKTNAHTLTLG